MGCQASRAELSPSSQPRAHRGAPPARLWVRGAGEEAANGSFTRVHPKKARNPRMPACLVVYVNKRGYSLTNCNLNKSSAITLNKSNANNLATGRSHLGFKCRTAQFFACPGLHRIL